MNLKKDKEFWYSLTAFFFFLYGAIVGELTIQGRNGDPSYIRGYALTSGLVCSSLYLLINTPLFIRFSKKNIIACTIRKFRVVLAFCPIYFYLIGK